MESTTTVAQLARQSFQQAWEVISLTIVWDAEAGCIRLMMAWDVEAERTCRERSDTTHGVQDIMSLCTMTPAVHFISRHSSKAKTP